MIVMTAACGRLHFDDHTPGLADALDDGSSVHDGSLQGDGPHASAGPWQLVQFKAVASSAQLSTTSAIVPGDLVVVALVDDAGDTVLTFGDNVGTPYTMAPTSQAVDTLGDAMRMYYAFPVTSGATTISTTLMINPPPALLVLWEFSGVAIGSADQSGLQSNLTGTTPTSASFVTSQPGELVVTGIVDEFAVSLHASSPFTTDSTLGFDGWAHLTDNHAAAGTEIALWDQTGNGAYCAVSLLFKPAP